MSAADCGIVISLDPTLKPQLLQLQRVCEPSGKHIQEKNRDVLAASACNTPDNGPAGGGATSHDHQNAEAAHQAAANF